MSGIMARWKSKSGDVTIPTLTAATAMEFPENRDAVKSSGSATVSTFNAGTNLPIREGRRVHILNSSGSLVITGNTGSTTRGQIDLLGVSSLTLAANDSIELLQKSTGVWVMVGLTRDEAGSGALDTTGAGAAAGTGNAATEYLYGGIVHKTVLTLTGFVSALADEAGVIAYKGTKIYDFPAGNIIILGAIQDIALTKSSAGVNADWDGDVSLGSVTASNNGTLTSTEANIIPSTATPQAVAGVTTADAVSTGVCVLDGTATAADVYLNYLVDDADHDVTGTACNLLSTGTVTLHWINLGDIA